MATSLHSPHPRLSSRRSNIMNPDMGPLAGIAFMLVAFFMSTSHFASRQPFVQLPTSYFPAGCVLTESEFYTITINKDNNIFFALENGRYKAFVIHAVAARHGINLTTQQLQELQKLPYTGMNVRRLPEYFTSSRKQQYAILKLGVPTDQLAEYVDAAREIYVSEVSKPNFCLIRADQQIPFAQFKRITNILQQRNINRFNLSTYGLAGPAGTI